MKSYTTPQLTPLGDVEQLTLDKNNGGSGGGGVVWTKPGTQNDGGAGLTRSKVIN